jgi:hypothetical protein
MAAWYNARSPSQLREDRCAVPTLLFVIFAVLLLAIIYALWRYWFSIAQVTPEEEEFDERVAALNERQANRISDEQLRRPLNEDDAWQIMVRRGRRPPQRRRRVREDRLRDDEEYADERERRFDKRHERYGGDLRRRAEERRARYERETRQVNRRRERGRED